MLSRCQSITRSPSALIVQLAYFRREYEGCVPFLLCDWDVLCPLTHSLIVVSLLEPLESVQ